MSASAYVEGGDGSSGVDVGSLEFLKWRSAQIAVTRRPACVALAAICLLPIPVYYGAGGGGGTSLERLVGFESFGHSGSLALCVSQAAFFLLVAYLSDSDRSLNRKRLQHYFASFLVALTLQFSVVLCPSCLLAIAAAPTPHGVAHAAALFAISCFLIDPSLRSALPAAATALASNACVMAYAPRETAVYTNFMSAPPAPHMPLQFAHHTCFRMWIILVIAVALVQVMFNSFLPPQPHNLPRTLAQRYAPSSTPPSPGAVPQVRRDVASQVIHNSFSSDLLQNSARNIRLFLKHELIFQLPRAIISCFPALFAFQNQVLSLHISLLPQAAPLHPVFYIFLPPLTSFRPL